MKIVRRTCSDQKISFSGESKIYFTHKMFGNCHIQETLCSGKDAEKGLCGWADGMF